MAHRAGLAAALAPGFVYKGLGGFGILRHPPTPDQATHPDPPDPYKHLRGGLRCSPGAERLPHGCRSTWSRLFFGGGGVCTFLLWL